MRGALAALAALAALGLLQSLAAPAAGGPAWRERDDVDGELVGGSADELTFWVEQRRDHFNREDRARWQQRYFKNASFWDAREGPVFVMLGGEGPESARCVLRGHHVKLAAQHRALLLCLEHRHYGDSFPVPDLSTRNLAFLSSEQALADLARFLGHVRAELPLRAEQRVVTFGGSYSGALSAWARIKLPHLVFAAVASSAPVRALTDFTGYDAVVRRSLGTELVGGSTDCVEQVAAAFAALGAALLRAQHAELAQLFAMCAPIEAGSARDISTMVNRVADLFQGAVQYNNQGSGPTVAQLCANMTARGDEPLKRLARLFRDNNRKSNCTDFSYGAHVASLNYTMANARSQRQWIFQTCSEYGYYQTCEKTADCVFAVGLDTLDKELDLCEDLFGIGRNEVADNVEASNLCYGADSPGGSRILFVNGLLDPWSALSVLQDQPEDKSVVLIEGASHCMDMGDDKPDDSAQLRTARAAIAAKVASWLALPGKVGADKTRSAEGADKPRSAEGAGKPRSAEGADKPRSAEGAVKTHRAEGAAVVA